MTSLHEQMHVWVDDERSDREGEAFEALPVTKSMHMPGLHEQMHVWVYDERSDREHKIMRAIQQLII